MLHSPMLEVRATSPASATNKATDQGDIQLTVIVPSIYQVDRLRFEPRPLFITKTQSYRESRMCYY
jgi:hypothetical protein